MASVAASTHSWTAIAGDPRQLDTFDLPGDVYDMAFDSNRNALFFAHLAGNPGGGPAFLYELEVGTGKLSRWPLPPTEYNGYLSRVAIAPDGAVWVTEDYDLARVDPKDGGVAHRLFDLADKDATKEGTDRSSLSPGTWLSGLTFDSGGRALVARHNVRSLLRVNPGLGLEDRLPLPPGLVGPGDIVDLDGTIVAAPFGGAGQLVLLDEQGTDMGRGPAGISRLAHSGQRVASLGPGTGGNSVALGNSALTVYPGGSLKDRLATTASGVVAYVDQTGQLVRYGASGALVAGIRFDLRSVKVRSSDGTFVSAFEKDQVGAIAVDGADTVWYVDLTTKQLVHLKI